MLRGTSPAHAHENRQSPGHCTNQHRLHTRLKSGYGNYPYQAYVHGARVIRLRQGESAAGSETWLRLVGGRAGSMEWGGVGWGRARTRMAQRLSVSGPPPVLIQQPFAARVQEDGSRLDQAPTPEASKPQQAGCPTPWWP